MVEDIAITILNMIMLISTITASTVLIINITGKINILGNPNTEMTTRLVNSFIIDKYIFNRINHPKNSIYSNQDKIFSRFLASIMSNYQMAAYR